MLFKDWIRCLANNFEEYKFILNSMIDFASNYNFIENYGATSSEILINNAKGALIMLELPAALIDDFPLLCYIMHVDRYRRLFAALLKKDTPVPEHILEEVYDNGSVGCELFKSMRRFLISNGKVMNGSTLPKRVKDTFHGNDTLLAFLDEIRTFLRFALALNSSLTENKKVILPIEFDGKSSRVSEWLFVLNGTCDEYYCCKSYSNADIGTIIEKINLCVSTTLVKNDLVLYRNIDIPLAYSSSLHRSCMNNSSSGEASDTIRYYQHLSDVILLGVKDKDKPERLVARCLIWRVGRDNNYIVDRVYDYGDSSGLYDMINTEMLFRDMTIPVYGGGEKTIRLIDIRKGSNTTADNMSFIGWRFKGDEPYFSKQRFDPLINLSEEHKEQLSSGMSSNTIPTNKLFPPSTLPWFDSLNTIRIREKLCSDLTLTLGGFSGTYHDSVCNTKNTKLKDTSVYVAMQRSHNTFTKMYTIDNNGYYQWHGYNVIKCSNGGFVSWLDCRILIDKHGNASIVNITDMSKSGDLYARCGLNNDIINNIQNIKIYDLTGKKMDLKELSIGLGSSLIIIKESEASNICINSISPAHIFADHKPTGLYRVPKKLISYILCNNTSDDSYIYVSDRHFVRVNTILSQSIDLSKFAELDRNLYFDREDTPIFASIEKTINDYAGRTILLEDSLSIGEDTKHIVLNDYSLKGVLNA